MIHAPGLTDGYEDAFGHWRPMSAATRTALRTAMELGARPPDGGAGGLSVRLIRPGHPRGVRGPSELILEDGTVLAVARELPPDLPLGYHTLRGVEDGASTRVICAPEACYLPQDLPMWGWAVQLYAARSRQSWGIGDLGDLRDLARWSRRLGAGTVLVNPLHAVTPLLPQQPSPYYPSSRRYGNPLYIRVEEAPGAGDAALDLAALATAGRALNRERRIDRDAIFRLKHEALAHLWSRFRGDPDFERYRLQQGPTLAEFATFCALAEHHGGGWRDWPLAHRRPHAPAVARFAADHDARVRFFEWQQWILDRQLARAGAEIRLMQDLPIGVDPNGADAWAWQDVLAVGASVGAPPDRFTPVGQDWGLPPFVPDRLRAAGYEPFIQTIRASLRHAGGLRIDHVMGLFRLYWIPRGAPPAEGGYVRYPVEDLLAIVAVESQRARALIVGEDLGTVEAGVRQRLAAERILSYRLMWFEREPPACFPTLALAAVTTHDLPTIAGLWTGADVGHQRGIGLAPNVEGLRQIRGRLRDQAGLADDATAGAVIDAAHRLLGAAPSVVVTASLDDVLGVVERPNMPGTTTEWPNWSLALPEPLEVVAEAPRARTIAEAFAGRSAQAPGSVKQNVDPRPGMESTQSRPP